MASDDIKTLRPRRLILILTAALVIAGAVAANGIMARARTQSAVAQWTDQQAVPTVALAKLVRGGTTRILTLPGTIQAYNKAPIYARVSGYLKSWQQDIGAHVKAGQLLASIDTPDLDQQFAQAQADLATAAANANLAAVTAGRWNTLREIAMGLAAIVGRQGRRCRRDKGDNGFSHCQCGAPAGDGVLQEHRRSVRGRRHSP